MGHIIKITNRASGDTFSFSPMMLELEAFSEIDEQEIQAEKEIPI